MGALTGDNNSCRTRAAWVNQMPDKFSNVYAEAIIWRRHGPRNMSLMEKCSSENLCV